MLGKYITKSVDLGKYDKIYRVNLKIERVLRNWEKIQKKNGWKMLLGGSEKSKSKWPINIKRCSNELVAREMQN